jgi:RHS repeat-associated protein
MMQKTGRFNPSGTSHTSPSLAVTSTNRKLLTITGYAQQTSTAPATGMTERVDNSTLPTAPTTSLHIADQTWASTAATGTRIATSAVASTSATISVALRPRANTTDYLYDINRHQILRKDPTNTVTLTIGNLELQQRAVSTPWATRYINIENTNIGIRNPAVNEWILDDERGSVQTTIDYTTGTTHQNFYTPYGQTRYAYPTNPTTPHSYLNQTNEPATQLTNLNNRYYDPAAGVFISVDPLVASTGDAYLYAHGNPTTFADPTGLDPWGGGFLYDVFFGSLVHSLIQADYMAMYRDSYAETNYTSYDVASGSSSSGRIDIATFDPSVNGGPLGLNEIKPTRQGAERDLSQRESDISGTSEATLRIPGTTGVSGMFQTFRDNRPFKASYDLLGVTVTARRNGPGVLTYSYTPGGRAPSIYRLLRELRSANERMRSRRDTNRGANQGAWDAGASVPASHMIPYLIGGAAVVGAVLAAPVVAAGAAGGAVICYGTGLCAI